MKNSDEDSGKVSEFSGGLMQKTLIASALERSMQPEAQIDTSTLAAFIGASAGIAALIVTGPIAGIVITAVAIISIFLPVVFPDDTWEPLVSRITELIHSLIDAAILKSAIAQANAALAANREQCLKISENLKEWAENGTHKSQLIAQYASLTADYASGLNVFLRSDMRTALVSQYAISALMYLTTISAFYPHADALGLYTGRFSSDKDALLIQLRGDIARFTDTALESYRLGLKEIIDRSKASTGKAKPTWDDYNEYRNKMTISALDYVTLFAYLDPLHYPSGCSKKYVNRMLLTHLDTNRVANSAALYRSDILATERLLNVRLPVEALSVIRFLAAHFIPPETHPYFLIDGVFLAQCTAISIDGYQTAEPEPRTATGRLNLSDIPISSLREFSVELKTGCFLVMGNFWNGSIRAPDEENWAGPRYVTAISNIAFFWEPLEDHDDFKELYTSSSLSSTDPVALTFFNQSIPGNQHHLVPLSSSFSMFSTRLADFKIFVDSTTQTHTYLLKWWDSSTVQDLLPAMTHVVNPEKNPVEQFHAIKAAKSIAEHKLKIIESPGFTGGDLVEVKAGTGVSFMLHKIPERWFAGEYAIRIWVIKPSSDVNVIVKVTPPPKFASSFADATIVASTPSPDLSNLKFNDLLPITLKGLLPLTYAMKSIELEFKNVSLGIDIILDRIELIFVNPAS